MTHFNIIKCSDHALFSNHLPIVFLSVHVSTYIILSLCPFSGLLLFSLLLLHFNKPEIQLTTTTTTN